MVRACAFLLAIPVIALADDDQLYMMEYKSHPGKCLYCHYDGNCGLYDCNKEAGDQHFKLKKVDEDKVDGYKFAYEIIADDDSQCIVALNVDDIKGKTDCDVGDKGERAFLLKPGEDGGIIFESAQFKDKCMASNDGSAFFLYTCQGQQWILDPPMDLEEKPDFVDPEASWDRATSCNDDCHYTLTVGMSHEDGHDVTKTDQETFGYSIEAEAKFFGMGMKESFSGQYAHSVADTVRKSDTKTSTESCTADCHSENLPEGYFGWDLMQFKVQAKGPAGVFTDLQCVFLCMPQGMEPRCPDGCCKPDVPWCQECNTEGGCPKPVGEAPAVPEPAPEEPAEEEPAEEEPAPEEPAEEEPAPDEPAASSECSSNPNCAPLELEGNCCPNDDGDMLDCCSADSAFKVV